MPPLEKEEKEATEDEPVLAGGDEKQEVEEKVKFGISNDTNKKPRALGEEIHGEGDVCGLLEGINLNEGRIPSSPGAYWGGESSGVGEGKREEKDGASEKEWKRMMEESRMKQKSLQKAEEMKNAARKARNRKQKKVEKGLTDVRNFWKRNESELAGQEAVERPIKDTVVEDRKRKNIDDTGLDSDMLGGRKRGCMEEAADATVAV